MLHWDFGVSSINGQLISEQLREVFPATMGCASLAFGFALLIGIPVGMIAGVMRNKWLRYPDQRRRAGRFLDPGLLAGAAPDPSFPDLGWLPVSGRFDLLYEVKNVTGFALIDARLSDSPWRMR